MYCISKGQSSFRGSGGIASALSQAPFLHFPYARSKVRRYCISTRGSWIHILVLANQIRPPDLLVLLSANQISATDHMTPFLQSDSSTWLVRLGGIIESGWGRRGRQLTRRCAEGWWTCVLPGGRIPKKSWRRSISISDAYVDGNVRLWQGGQGHSLLNPEIRFKWWF